jgi:nucleotide-binding universal stress UspA family protein
MKDIRTVLLTTDLSEDSKKAVAAALVVAKKFGAKIVLAFVGDWFPPHPEQYYIAIDFDQIRKETRERARADLARFAKENLKPGIDVKLEVPLGVPHVEIVNLARKHRADLIVMAPHGRGFIAHALLGSTTDRVLRQAPCPVLVVREPAPGGRAPRKRVTRAKRGAGRGRRGPRR